MDNKTNMKNTIIFFTLIVVLLVSGRGFAQQKAEIKMGAVKQDGKNVDLTLTSAKKFIVGGNYYILYVGDKEFSKTTQAYYKGMGSLTFFIPVGDFSNLTEGADMYLTYGRVFKNATQGRDEIAKVNAKCWSLGKFSKKLLKK